MLTNRTLARVNNRPREVARLPLLAVGGGTLILAALLYVFEILPSFAILAVLLGGALLVLVLFRTQKAKMTISLSYKGNLSEEAASRFTSVREALEALASSGRIWRLPGSVRLPKANKVAPSPEREPVRVGLLATPGIRADVPVWGIEAGDESLFFFPEGALIYRDDRYDPLPYNSLKVAFSSRRFFEEELSNDATVVERTWRFSRPDGSPDPRYKKDNVEIPIVLYGLLMISTPSGPKVRLEVSDRLAAARFARTFGAEVSTEEPNEEKAGYGEEHRRANKDSGRSTSKEGGEERRSAEILEREASLAAARRALGVSKGAGVEEISAAYRKLARTHHPDKVANLEPEVREYSEQRMKEINAAYAEFKRHWNDPSNQGARVGEEDRVS
jgi:DnaJ-like protein